MKKVSAILLGCCVLGVTLSFAATRYVPEEDVKTTMKGYCRALGVKCTFCHVSDKSINIHQVDDYDIDRDLETLTHKRVARAMTGMTKLYNKMHGTNMTCNDCHQGKTRPPKSETLE